MVALVVVIGVCLFLWFSGFNIFIGGIFNAYFSTWADSPMMGVVLTIGVGVALWIINLIKKI